MTDKICYFDHVINDGTHYSLYICFCLIFAKAVHKDILLISHMTSRFITVFVFLTSSNVIYSTSLLPIIDNTTV